MLGLLDQHAAPYALHGHIETVLGWLSAAPEELVHERPILCLLHTGLLLATNQFARAAALLDWAEQRAARGAYVPDTHAFLAHVTTMRSTLTRFLGDLPASVTLGHQAVRMQPQPAFSAAMLSAAHEFLVTGDVSPAAQQRLNVS